MAFGISALSQALCCAFAARTTEDSCLRRRKASWEPSLGYCVTPGLAPLERGQRFVQKQPAHTAG